MTVLSETILSICIQPRCVVTEMYVVKVQSKLPTYHGKIWACESEKMSGLVLDHDLVVTI